jgi:hypothetical protein
MRVGVKVGPFYASAGSRRRGRRGGNSMVQVMFGLIIVVGVLFWPLDLAQTSNGGLHWWGWLLLPPWWFILLLVYGLYSEIKNRKKAYKGGTTKK